MASGAEIIAKTLDKEGVKYVFSLPDGWIMPVYEELERLGIGIILMRHEQAAANAADGWARIKRELGVVLTAVGPGIANIMPGLAQAFYAGSPVLALGGRAPIKNIDRMAFEEIDGYRWVERFTKFSKLCISTCRLYEYIQDAIRNALTPPMGPAFLEIPKDVSGGYCEEEFEYLPPDKYRVIGRLYGDPRLIKKAVDLIINAERPFIIAGSGVYWSGGCEELVKLAEIIKAPIATEGLAVGCISSEHSLYGGHAGIGLISREADLIITAGARFDEFLGFGENPDFYSNDVKIIHIDINPYIIGKNRPVDIGIWGDAKAVVSQLIEEIRRRRFRRGESEWSDTVGYLIKAFYEKAEKEADSDEKPIRPQRLMKEVREFAGRDSIFILDGGDTTAWAYLYLKAYGPGQVVWSQGPLGHIGGGIPMGIAAKLAEKDKTVYVITGDGSFLMNAVEIDTAVRYKIPIIVVIANDSAWGDVYHNRVLLSGKEDSGKYALLAEEKYDKFAESLGAYGEHVSDPGEIREALKRAIDSGLPAVVDVKTSRKYISPLSQLLGVARKK